MEGILETVRSRVVDGDKATVQVAVSEALDSGVAADSILRSSLIIAMAEGGARTERGEYFLPEMMASALAMKAGLALLKPRLVQSQHPTLGKVVLGTVRGDTHDIGKNLVGMMLEGAGF